MWRSFLVVSLLVYGFSSVNAQNQALRQDPKIEKLIANYTHAIEIDPNDAGAYINRGNLYSAKGETSLAIADFSKAIELRPQLAAGYYNRGSTHFNKGDITPALEDFSRAITVDPKFAAAYVGRGTAHAAKGEFDLSIIDYTKAIGLGPETAKNSHGLPQKFGITPERAVSALAYNNRGLAYGAKSDFDRAIADHKQAVEYNPLTAEYTFSLGVAIFGKGDFESAAAAFSDYLKRQDSIRGILFSALAERRAGSKLDSQAELEERGSRFTSRSWPYLLVDFYLGKISPAAVLDAAASSDRCEAQFFIGEWHLLKKEIPEATIALKVALHICPITSFEHIVAAAEADRLKR